MNDPLRTPDDYDADVDDIFRDVAEKWWDQLKQAIVYRRDRFMTAAEEIVSFYNGPKDWTELMGFTGADDDMPEPMFKISVNKAFEYVDIFGPALYYDNPVRTIKPRMPVDVPPDFFPDVLTYQNLTLQEQIRVQQDGLKATLLSAYLNWSPHQFNLSDHSRRAIEEGLLKGASCIWTELFTPPGSKINTVRSYFDSVDNFLIDPDAPSLDEARWIARRVIHPAWQVERDFGLARGALKHAATDESIMKMADIEASEEARDERKRGRSNDLVTYYKIWSKMGIGGRLPGIKREYKPALEVFGDYAYLCICDRVNYPLNLPPHLQNDPSFAADQQKVFGAVAWPTPFWAKSAWPVSLLRFHSVPGCAWPLPPLKAGLGELKALNWIYSFMVGHIHSTARDFVVFDRAAAEETKRAIFHGRDLEQIELDLANGRSVSDVVAWLQHPQMNKDIWTVIEAMEKLFDKRVGLTDLMYGTSEVQLRSAEEAQLKGSNMNVRPADMAKQVEAWQAEVAAKEAMCARYHLTSQDVLPVLGSAGAYAWDAFVASRDAAVVASELEYQIEAGSTQRPNKQFEISQMTEAVQTMLPVFQQYMVQTGDVNPLNNLISDWAKTRDLDPNRYVLTQAPPPPPLNQPPGSPNAAQQEPNDNPIPQG